MQGNFRYRLTIFKTVSWELLSTPSTLLLVYLFTGRSGAILLGSFACINIMTKFILFFLHERVWYSLLNKKERNALPKARELQGPYKAKEELPRMP